MHAPRACDSPPAQGGCKAAPLLCKGASTGRAAHRIMPPNSKRRPFAKVEVASASAGEILSG